MPRFLVEVEHDPGPDACKRAVEVFLRTGSHYFTHADWGCMDGEHKTWIIMELDSRHEALNLVPADYRARARAIQLNTFTIAQLDQMHRKAT